MRRSLFFKLLGAFALVILVLAVIVSVLVNRATAGQFRLYADRNGQLWAAQLAPQLADYYARQGSWQGVEAALQGANAMMGPGMGMMDGGMMHRGAAGRDMWSMMGLRVVLADPAGRVLSDSAGVLVGQTLAADQLAAGAAIRVDGRLVGTVLVAAQPALAAESPAAAFLRNVNRSILLAVAAAGLIALVLGAGLFFHLTAPIRQLTAAAHAIAAGDLSRRVDVRSADELGELAAAFNAMAASLAAAEAQRRQMVADVPRSACCRPIWRRCKMASCRPMTSSSPHCTKKRCCSAAWWPTYACSRWPRPGSSSWIWPRPTWASWCAGRPSACGRPPRPKGSSWR